MYLADPASLYLRVSFLHGSMAVSLLGRLPAYVLPHTHDDATAILEVAGHVHEEQEDEEDDDDEPDDGTGGQSLFLRDRRLVPICKNRSNATQ